MNALTWIDTAVCLGNGQSRQGLDLKKMKDYATVIGCNAIYRDFTPDILVALDSAMSHEIYRKANLNDMKTYLGYWTPIPNMIAMDMKRSCQTKIDSETTEDGDDCVFHGGDFGTAYLTETKESQGPVIDIEPNVDEFAYCTGTRSIHLACELSAKKVFIVGHDLNIDNNLYTGTNAYVEKTLKSALDNWILQHKNTFDKFKDVQFYKVDKAKVEMSEWQDCANLKYITQEEMEQQLYN